jgi:hypothetical protein
MSRSHASRHARRVPRSAGCVRRCVGVARAAREGLPPLGGGLRTPRRASTRASSATKAPQRSPRGTRPSSPPPRPGGTRTEPRRTRPQALRQPRALDAGPRSCCPRISTNENPAFARFDASHASPFDVTASDFKRGIPKETSRESAAEVAYARSYEEPTPGSGDRPFTFSLSSRSAVVGHQLQLFVGGGAGGVQCGRPTGRGILRPL